MEKKLPIAGHMELQPIFAITANLARERNKDTGKNTPFKTKWIAALKNSSPATDKEGEFNDTISQVQLNLNLTYYATQYPPQISLKLK